MELSNRLQAVANLVPKGSVAADIGCDHGYVAIWLVEEKICSKVIAMDVNKGPLERAKQNIEAHNLSSCIDIRLSNGAEKLLQGEADTLVCAGMGGKLTIGILERSIDKIKEMPSFVIQPQSDLKEVRRFLREQDFTIVKEDMILEDDKFYPMMLVETKVVTVINHTDSGKLGKENTSEESSDWKQEIEDTFGPLLLAKAHPVLKIFLEKQIQVCDTILQDLTQRQHKERGIQRITELTNKRDDMLKVLECYFQ